MNISPTKLPSISELCQRATAIAMLDAIISPNWENRCFTFDPCWGPEEKLASMRNGSGDEWFLVFMRSGALLKGFAHESLVGRNFNIAHTLEKTLPSLFTPILQEPAFSMNAVSFCYWRTIEMSAWQKVTLKQSFDESLDDDGSATLISVLINPPEAYKKWALDYFEVSISSDVIESFYSLKPLTQSLTSAVNPAMSFHTAQNLAKEIGYPVALE